MLFHKHPNVSLYCIVFYIKGRLKTGNAILERVTPLFRGGGIHCFVSFLGEMRWNLWCSETIFFKGLALGDVVSSSLNESTMIHRQTLKDAGRAATTVVERKRSLKLWVR